MRDLQTDPLVVSYHPYKRHILQSPSLPVVGSVASRSVSAPLLLEDGPVHNFFACGKQCLDAKGRCHAWPWVPRVLWCCTGLLPVFSLDYFHGSITRKTVRLANVIVQDNCPFNAIGQEACEESLSVRAGGKRAFICQFPRL